jgi:hypothetical protein
MGKLIILSESEKNHILSLYEVKTPIIGGGKIVFTIEGKVGSNKTDLIYNTLKNKLTMKNKLKKIVSQLGISGFTLTGPNKGLYKDNEGNVVGDTSYTIESLGIDSELLEELSSKILESFPAESVLVYDYNTNENYFYSLN